MKTKRTITKAENADRFPPTLAVRVYLLLRETYKLADKVFESDFRNFDLSSSQYTVLRYLHNDEAIPMSELSRRLTQGKSNLTTLIPRMERKGLVETTVDARDKRSSLVRLTDTGRRLRDQVVPAHRRLLEAMLRRLGPEEQEQFVHLLAQINRSLTEVMKEAAKGEKRWQSEDIVENG